MTRKKRTSRTLEKAELRIAGLKSIDPKLDFGDTRTINHLSTQIEQLRTKIDAYNTALAVIDSSKTEIDALEKDLGDLTDKMLIGVAFTYGKDSREYEMAGGVRKSERVRRSSSVASKQLQKTLPTVQLKTSNNISNRAIASIDGNITQMDAIVTSLLL